jgi:hypothetical protein
MPIQALIHRKIHRRTGEVLAPRSNVGGHPMLQATRAVSACVILLSTGAGIHAQVNPSSKGEGAQPSVPVQGKSALAAGALELVLPTVGFAYAGHWARGLPPTLFRVAGVYLALDQQMQVPLGGSGACVGQCTLGLTLAAAGTIWAVIDAAIVAKRSNEERGGPAARISETPTGGSLGPEIGVGADLPYPMTSASPTAPASWAYGRTAWHWLAAPTPPRLGTQARASPMSAASPALHATPSTHR